MSDNGAAANDFYYSDYFDPFLQKHFNNDYDNMGQPNSFVSYGPQWAEASTSPFRYFKGMTTEGSMNTSMIISGPRVTANNEVHHGFVSIMDLAPSFYELAQIQYPNSFENNEVYPLKGNSLIPLIGHEVGQVHDEEHVFALEHSDRAMLRKSDWKITNIIKPFSIDNFELYNLSNDLAEQNDLKESNLEKYEELLEEWDQFSKKIQLQVPAPAFND